MQLKWTSRIKLDQDGANRINEIAGVYRLIYYSPEKNDYYVYYVGQADNLKSRLSQHLIEAENNACCSTYLKKYTCYFRAAGVSSQADRDGAEVALFNKFKPTCTERIPDVEPININFE